MLPRRDSAPLLLAAVALLLLLQGLDWVPSGFQGASAHVYWYEPTDGQYPAHLSNRVTPCTAENSSSPSGTLSIVPGVQFDFNVSVNPHGGGTMSLQWFSQTGGAEGSYTYGSPVGVPLTTGATFANVTTGDLAVPVGGTFASPFLPVGAGMLQLTSTTVNNGNYYACRWGDAQAVSTTATTADPTTGATTADPTTAATTGDPTTATTTGDPTTGQAAQATTGTGAGSAGSSTSGGEESSSAAEDSGFALLGFSGPLLYGVGGAIVLVLLLCIVVGAVIAVKKCKGDDFDDWYSDDNDNDQPPIPTLSMSQIHSERMETLRESDESGGGEQSLSSDDGDLGDVPPPPPGEDYGEESFGEDDVPPPPPF